jgi:hypothetical protein
MKKFILLLLLALAPFAVAQDCTVDTLAIEPSPVTDRTTDAELLVRGTCAHANVPYAPVVLIREDNVIVIEFHRAAGGLAVPAPWGERVRLPMLAAGTYEIELTTDPFRGQLLGSTTLQVLPQEFTVTPSFGSEGTEVMITGLGTAPECQGVCPPAEVFFGNVKARNMRFGPRGELIVTVPPNTGSVPVRIQQGNGTVTAGNAFRYGPPFEGDMERVLFPVNLAVRGAFGSDWTTDLAVRNDGPITIDTRPHFYARPDTPVLPIPGPIVAGGKGYFPFVMRDGGQFLYTPRRLEKFLSYASHVVDRSRSDIDLGTEVPVVRDEDAADVIKLLEVPVDARYRAKLRVYNLDQNGVVGVILRDPVDGRTVQRAVELTGYEVCANPPCFSERAAFGVLDLDSIPELRTMQNGVDVTIKSPTRDARLWGFVTVTNNETQHVTVYTPQHRTRAQ